jgi:aspartate-semialdehyde dehydrogenase
VNGEAVMDYKKKMIIANPNCSTAQLVVALKPLHDPQASSASSSRPTSPSPAPARMGMDELWNQTKRHLCE